MDGQSLNITTEKIQQLKALFPEVFSEDKIDFQRLKIALGEDNFVKGEHYELSWAGKTEARKEIQKQSSATLNSPLTPEVSPPPPEGGVNTSKTPPSGGGGANHLFIEGENLEVLRTLQKSYFGKVKMIYIDPPYNTGNDSFVYPDNFEERQKAYKERANIVNENGDRNSLGFWQTNHRENGQFHSVWLSMMYPRLYLSRNLLKEDGIIFISIDDNEASNLKLLCDEIFGEENFVALFPRVTKKAGKSSEEIAKNNDYIVCYQKSNQSVLNTFEHIDDGFKYSDEFVEERGIYKLNQTLDYGSIQYSQSLDYEIEIEGKIIRAGGVSKEEMEERKIRNPKSDFCWRWSKDLFDFGYKNGFVVLKEGKNGFRIYTKTYQNATISKNDKGYFVEIKQRTKSVSTLDFIENEFSNDNSRKDLTKIFENSVFEYSKPVFLIKYLINIVCKPTENHIILDFFAGSGTTAQAVMELNEEDGGNRQFICVQLPEPTDENSEAHKAGYKTIADITKARIRKVIEKIGKEREGKLNLQGFKNLEGLSFQHFVLAESNFKVWRSDIQGSEAIALQLFEHQQSEKESDNHDNLFVELCLKSGLGLNVVYKQENDFYKVEQEIWFCFEKYTATQKEIILAEKPQKLVYLNSCFESDVALSNFQLELKEYDIKLQLI
jgi:adenine-specific DNA-methyltransferase